MVEQVNRAALIAALEQERDQILALLPQFSDEQWRTLTREDGWTVHDIANHVADTTYGLALMLLGKATAPMAVDPATGWFSADAYNEMRRQKNRDLPREKVMSRMASAFDTVRQAIEAIEDYDAAVTFGPPATTGYVFQRIIDHSAGHRAELEAIKP